MKVGDLIKLPEGEGYAIAMKVVDSKPHMSHHPYQNVMAIENGYNVWRNAHCCEVIQ